MSFEKDFPKLAKKLKINTDNIDIFTEAFTHRSFLNEFKQTPQKHNEKLEFLGDAVLELVVTEYLFANFPIYNEGDLTSFRAALVKTESLAEEAKKLDLGEIILMSKGEEATGGRSRPYILANTMEALIGAIYLSNGYDKSKEFIINNICPKTETIINERLDIDAKSKLQELAQETVKITPTYNLVGATGPDHNKTFEMAVLIGEYEFGKGDGKSKQEAEQSAANFALKNWDKQYKKYFKNSD